MTSPHDPTDESSFLDEYDPEEFDRLSVAVDVALLTIVDDRLAVVVLERADHPHRGRWQLPGGFVAVAEALDETAARVLHAKAGIDDVYTEQLYTFGAVDRDPRTRVVAVSYYALVHPEALRLRAGVRLAMVTVPWSGEAGGPVTLTLDGNPLAMAFDHADIIGLVVQRLRGKLAHSTIGFELLPLHFTLLDLQRVHETILGRSVNKDSFRRSMLASGRLEPTGERQSDVGHRPAALYRHVPRHHTDEVTDEEGAAAWQEP